VAPEPTEIEALSAEQIFTDLHEELVGLHRVLGPEELLGCLPATVPAEQIGSRLRALLGRAWSASWRKAVNKKRRPHKPKRKELGAHTSVHKILEAAKAADGEKQKASASSEQGCAQQWPYPPDGEGEDSKGGQRRPAGDRPWRKGYKRRK
jgi:hypothetical protein